MVVIGWRPPLCAVVVVVVVVVVVAFVVVVVVVVVVMVVVAWVLISSMVSELSCTCSWVSLWLVCIVLCSIDVCIIT